MWSLPFCSIERLAEKIEVKLIAVADEPVLPPIQGKDIGRLVFFMF